MVDLQASGSCNGLMVAVDEAGDPEAKMEGEDEDFQFYACCSFRPEGSTCRNMLETLIGESGTSQGHLAREV